MNVLAVMNIKRNTQFSDVIVTLAGLSICLAVGYLMQGLYQGFPASLYGMICFTIALHFKWLSAKRFESTIAWCIRHMGVCFVPAGVGIIEHQQLISEFGAVIVIITFITTFIILSFVGKCYNPKRKDDINLI
ncbi:CidA/LrgA family protein [Thalassotalea ganghwensis]